MSYSVFVKSSTEATARDRNNAKLIDMPYNIKIVNVINKKQKDPSSVRPLKVITLPNFIPNIAAAESDITVISIDRITISFVNNNVIIRNPKIINEAPINLSYS